MKFVRANNLFFFRRLLQVDRRTRDADKTDYTVRRYLRTSDLLGHSTVHVRR